ACCTRGKPSISLCRSGRRRRAHRIAAGWREIYVCCVVGGPGGALMIRTGIDRPATQGPAQDPAEFSLVLGGPIYQLLRRARLTDDALTLVHRRILGGVLITWVPLLLFAMWEGQAWGGDV